MKLGMIGLDTSHCTAFAELLHDANHAYYVPGATVAVAFPGGSPDIELSRTRVGGFTERLAGEFGVKIVDSPVRVAEEADAILIEAMDGRAHLSLFREIAHYGKPVFIDKPLAVRSEDALAIRDLAAAHGVPLMSGSSLRFSGAVQEALDGVGGREKVIGADCFGPMAIEPSQPGWFWYGIHTVEMLYAAMGPGCVRVTASVSADHDVAVGEWRDGRIGIARGNRSGNYGFGAAIHGIEATRYADVSAYAKPFYASLVERIVEFCRTGEPAVPIDETVEIIRFMEAANESRETGKPVVL
ncbi:Gfo/Idh/MocA family oxidoreductase [Paenibacillus sp.]|uniref:Gfo/Idh/MocA family protein n=1 Tax=Paenibacillus sp. TaxID=58172 RepID=UPI0028112A06|nr:Gfo/Idh/MocA family oxidoreductase [Paenibacillus sp.]